MQYKYFSYKHQGRPTREETMEVVFDTYLKMSETMKKLENIFITRTRIQKKTTAKI